MKKTISINIGGIIFHIEEDGYDRLKQYLDSINKYFSTFDESTEILSDIEGRIAELFLLKLSDGRQTLTMEDVEELIATMGTTNDFEASIEDDPADHTANPKTEGEESSEEASEEGSEETTSDEPKRLFRDSKRGVIGGVAAGIAHYFSIDPLWVRLVFLALLINIFFYGLSTAVFVGYIILWFVMPPSENLSDNQKVKKLFRNEDDRVLGGIAAGIAAYFGIDVVVVRLLFVLSIFLGGSGILLYIVLWIITPIAKTVTEKMQMSGEPVTLKNIETSLKKSFKVSEGEEKPLTKILLFPFRLLASLIQGIGRILGPLLKFIVDLIRVLFGSILIFAGFVLMGALIGVFAGLYTAESSIFIDHFLLPIDLIHQSLSGVMMASIFLTGIVPAIGLVILGLVVISKRWLVNAAVGWSLFALWMAGIIMGAITIPTFVSEFHKTGSIKKEETYSLASSTPTLKVNDIGFMGIDNIDLILRGTSDSIYTALIETESRGSSRLEAQNNAEKVSYQIEERGGDFYFDSKITFLDSSKFRFQHVNVTFFIPFDKVFRMDQDLEEILSNTIHRHGYRTYDISGNDWIFKAEEGLICVTCEKRSTSKRSIKTDDEDWDLKVTPKKSSYEDSDELSFPFEDFNSLVIGSIFDIEITKGNDYSVKVLGDEDILEEVYLNQVGQRLEVSFKKGDWKWWKKGENQRVKLMVTMPQLEGLEIDGACSGEVIGFDEEQMSVSIDGASDLYLKIDVEYLDLDMEGISEISLKGKGKELDINIDGASKLNSLDFVAEHVTIEAEGASKAIIFGSQSIQAKSEGASSIRYRGSSNITIDEEGMSSVEKY